MSEQSKPKAGPADEVVPDCPHCGKPLPLCICDSVTPIDSNISLLILQHPQEQDRALGTARLTARHFKDAVVKIGLSWPSLSKALGRPVHDPSRWAVLYLGSAKVAELDTDAEIVAINRKGEIEPHQRAPKHQAHRRRTELLLKIKYLEWRPRPELNWCTRFCRPLRNHSATWPHWSKYLKNQ